ncbi:989_t:CDS:1, partial [Racocetra fulgida]
MFVNDHGCQMVGYSSFMYNHPLFHPSSNGLIPDALYKATPDMEIPVKTVGNEQSSCSSAGYDEMNCTPRQNSHSVNSNANKSNANN